VLADGDADGARIETDADTVAAQTPTAPQPTPLQSAVRVRAVFCIAALWGLICCVCLQEAAAAEPEPGAS
jgi:hypothetical protein